MRIYTDIPFINIYNYNKYYVIAFHKQTKEEIKNECIFILNSIRLMTHHKLYLLPIARIVLITHHIF